MNKLTQMLDGLGRNPIVVDIIMIGSSSLHFRTTSRWNVLFLSQQELEARRILGPNGTYPERLKQLIKTNQAKRTESTKDDKQEECLAIKSFIKFNDADCFIENFVEVIVLLLDWNKNVKTTQKFINEKLTASW